MERTLIKDTPKKIGEKVRLCGWVNTRRDHGKMVFIDLRDRTGLVQIVGDEKLGNLRSEYVIEVEGLIKKRPANMTNDKIATGEVEIEVEKVNILAKSKELPFPIETDGYEINEEKRLKYRFLDLRRSRLLKNLINRHQFIKSVRLWFNDEGFIEVETPILTKSTPEGARDFIIPSRLQQGKFYALPQSPQQYKQLLMVAGLEKYFQIARCFRDEDLRADRQLEFTQLDIEMSFVEREDILNLIEKLMIDLVEAYGKKIYQKPFPRISYQEAMKKYGDDKFDLREKKEDDVLAFAFVIDQPLFSWKKEEKRWDSSHHPFTAPNPKDLKFLENGEIEKVRSWQYDLVCNGSEVGGGSIRITNAKLQEKIFEILGHKKEQIKNKFGHLLEAFEYGVPPHGGVAFGLDRLIAIFNNEDSIREVIAFPVTSSGESSVMDAPSEVDQEQLKELGIQITPTQKDVKKK
ncbi:MAG: aspartate--tRNA ligase [Candidatus Shapirobacteria bacterium]|nr:aspartate--tRNA ligase [Candidatus Shapirobacteria bacterium]